jgi:hypothetical protein
MEGVVHGPVVAGVADGPDALAAGGVGWDRYVGGPERDGLAALFEEVDRAGHSLAEELELEAVDEERLQHLAEAWIFDADPSEAGVVAGWRRVLRGLGDDVVEVIVHPTLSAGELPEAEMECGFDEGLE